MDPASSVMRVVNKKRSLATPEKGVASKEEEVASKEEEEGLQRVVCVAV